MKKIIATMLSLSLLISSISIMGAHEEERRVSDSIWNERSYSTTYQDIKTLESNVGRDTWRYGLVMGNGENGMVESCGPATDVMIFQNMKFNYPSNAIRMTPDTSSVREETMQSILNYSGKYLSPEGAQNANNLMLNSASEWMKEMGLGDKWSLQWTYSFHPGHQLRIQMQDAKNGEEKFYERYTDYQTGEIGTNWVDKDGNGWQRRSFASREDNVNFTSIKSTDGKKLSLTLTIDDIARMSNEGGADVKNLRYRKIVDTKNGDYIGISAHYPYYPNSLLNNGGYAGITRVVAVGGTKEYVFGTKEADNYVNPRGNATDVEMNLGEDKNPAIRITDADEVILITKTELDRNFATLGEFEADDKNPLYVEKLIEDTKEAWEKYLDYDKALYPSKEKHREIFNRLSYSVCVSEEDLEMRKCTNEELIALQQKNPDKMLPAMLERLYSNGRFANICSSGIQAPRLGGMWTGAFGVAWSGDYTTDANINLQVAGANIGSVEEETIGFMNVMIKTVTDWQLNAKQIYGIDDALLAPTRTDGDAATLIHFGSWPGQMWLSGAPWLIFPMYEYYQCFGNEQIPLTPDIRAELEFTGNKYEGYTKVTDKFGTKGKYYDYGIYHSETGERVVYNLRNTLSLTDERAEEILKQGYFDLEKDILYPLITKTVNFYTDFVDERYYVKDGVAYFDESHTKIADDEYWYYAPSYSPENAPAGGKEYTANAAMDSSASRNMVEFAIELENKLNYEGKEERIAGYEYYMKHIPPYLYEESGELKEWTLYGYRENYPHRHGSQLYGLWPLYEAESDKVLFDGAKKLIETKNSIKNGDNKGAHGWLHRLLAAARVKDSEGFKNSIMPLISKNMIYSSMMMNHNTDNSSAYCTDPVITIPAALLESMVYTDTTTLELLPAVGNNLNCGGSLSGTRGVSLRSGGVLNLLEWDYTKVTAKITNSKGVKLKLTKLYDTLFVNGVDKTEEIQTDETGDKYYLIDTDETVNIQFILSKVEKIEVSADKYRVHNGEKVKIDAVCYPMGTEGYEWVVEGEGNITSEGIFTPTGVGDVYVYAKAIGSDTVSEKIKIVVTKGLETLSKAENFTICGREESEWEKKSPPLNAFDGNINTAYDGQNGGWCGIELENAAKIGAFRFMSRVNNEGRMPGVKFQVSKDGVNYMTIYTVTDGGSHGEYVTIYRDELIPELGKLLRDNAYKYFRMISGESKFSNIAEIEVYLDYN